jgi:hypothetical protein
MGDFLAKAITALFILVNHIYWDQGVGSRERGLRELNDLWFI